MRLLSTLIVSLVSVSAFAASPFGHWANASFSGNGEWKADCGKTGTYSATVSIKDNVLTEAITIDGKTNTYSLVAIPGQNGFFQVTASPTTNAVIGGGYCYDQFCHYGIEVQGMGVEESFYLDKGKLYSTGSKWMKNAAPGQCQAAAWRGVLSVQTTP